MPGPVTVRVRMTLAYDGRPFRGFAAQRGLPTVAGALTTTLERTLGAPIDLVVAGRTDAGVHAWGQVVSFDAPAGSFDPVGLQRSLNRQLAPTIVIREVAEAAADFHARFSATARRYRYSVLNRPWGDPFLAATTWHVPEPLDLGALRLACDPLVGEHDFTSFCRTPKGQPEASLVRRVAEARWTVAGDGLLWFEIEATSFCQQMVRAVVGTVVAMGTGRRRAGEMSGILVRRRRAAAERVAPAHGLCLRLVRYGESQASSVTRTS